MPLKYHSGEEIKPGDRVLLYGEPGQIEVVADPLNDPHDWYVIEFGGGVLILEPKVFGRLFMPKPEAHDYLQFVARGDLEPEAN